MEIHAVRTGSVIVKERQRVGVGRGRRRFLNMLLDRAWTDPLPILAWVVEHPEGLIVVDTGETSRSTEPGYFPPWHPYFRFGVRMLVDPEDDVGPKIEALGFHPSEVRWVVMTHLHTDHAGGLHSFPRSEILVTRTEIDLASGPRGRARGYLNHRFPEWFDPRPIEFADVPFGPFPASRPLTAARDVHLVPVPGHTSGQMAVVVEDDDALVFIAGDTSYSQQLMLDGLIDGVSPSDEAAHESLRRVRALAEERPTVYLPTHDPDSVRRLRRRTTARVGDTEARALAR